MLKMVDGTGIIGVDMICPLGVSTPQPPNYDKVELEGTGMLVLPNSLDAPLDRLELGGKTEQVQTTGAQLFEAKNAELNKWVGSTGIIATVGRNCIFRLNVKPNTVYQVNILSASSTFAFSQFSKENVFLKQTVFSKGTKSFKCTTTENVDYAYFLIGDTVDNINGIINDVMLYEGEEYKNYEPYTGGKPAPSPEYPQEIKNSGKWNEETQKYEVDVKVVGKNVFDVNYFTKNENYQNKDGDATYWKYATFEVKPNTTYAVSKQKNTNVNGAINNGLYYGGALAFNNDVNSVKITTKDDGLLYVMFFYRNEDVNILKEMNIQVELGDTQTPYQLYKEQTLTLTSDRPITKWDRLVEQGGEIGWLYGSNTVVIDGSETWSSSNVPDHIYFTTAVNNKSGRINTSLCKTYKNNGEPVFNKKHEGEYNIYSDHPTNGVSDTAFVPPNETVTTIPQWKEWLNANPIEMLYKTKTTEFVPLPQEEQDAIRALKTYYPTTVITADGGELDPDIKVTYRKEI